MSSIAVALEDMGFPKEKVEKALQMTGNQGLEQAMDWLLAHGDEMDISETLAVSAGEVPSTSVGPAGGQASGEASTPSGQAAEEAKSIKCEECGRLFKSQLEIEFHAAKSGHSQFAESTEEKKPLTEEEKQKQLQLLEQKMKEKKKEREEKEKAEALEREKNRIKSGKEMVAVRKKIEDDEIRKAAEQRRREKEEDKLARQKIIAQIEADKRARKMKSSSGGGGAGQEETTAEAPTKQPTTTTPVASAPAKDYTQTRIQVRLTDGQTLTETFGVKEQLSAIRLYVEMNRTDPPGPFTFMTNFPKKIFQGDDYEKPLEALGLVPSAVLIVTKSHV